MLILLAILACRGDPEEVEVVEPSAYVTQDDEEPAPAFDPDELAAAVQEAVDLARTLTADPIFAGYDVAMAGQEDTCPRWYGNEAGTYWFDQCTASDGTSFQGYGFEVTYDADAQGDYLTSGRGFSGAARIETPAGTVFDAAGTGYLLESTFTGDDNIAHVVFQNAIDGTFAWDGVEAEDTWMSRGHEPALGMMAYWLPDHAATFFYLDGGIGGLDAADGTVVFAEVLLMSEAISTCPIEPSGTISIRDPDGSWYDLLFDGPTGFGEETPADDCDGCGAAWWRGAHVGTVCADFSELTAWEERPW